jgi:hypothetical protein
MGIVAITLASFFISFMASKIVFDIIQARIVSKSREERIAKLRKLDQCQSSSKEDDVTRP